MSLVRPTKQALGLSENPPRNDCDYMGLPCFSVYCDLSIFPMNCTHLSLLESVYYIVRLVSITCLEVLRVPQIAVQTPPYVSSKEPTVAVPTQTILASISIHKLSCHRLGSLRS